MIMHKMQAYHVPNQGLYVYSRVVGNKAELIILNSTDQDQVLRNEHYQVLTQGSLQGVNALNGEIIDLQAHLVLPARKSLIIEY